MDDRQRRIARARLLRRDGKTYDEIRSVLGDVPDHHLEDWLRGVPRPPTTLRGRVKDDLRRTCRRLRAAGLSYSEIAAETGASKGSISPWVRDVKLPARSQVRRRELDGEARRRIGAAHRERAAARRDDLRRTAAAEVGRLSERELFIAGLALYWAEGSKDTPWRRNGRVTLINSDPTVLDVYLSWLDLVGVPESDRTYRLNIHETADVARHENWWATRLGVPLASFSKATIKKHNPSTVRHNSGDSYRGCLVVNVARSGWLYYAIEGWWQAISEDVGSRTDGAH